MIPLTPLLLITGAHALMRHALVLPRLRPDLPCSLEFVQAVGTTSHLSLVGGCSSWPIVEVSTVSALAVLAQRSGWERERACSGDLLLLPARWGTTEDEVAIVLHVLERSRGHDDRICQCALVVARRESADRMRLVEEVRWIDSRAGEVPLRWYAYFDDVERAA